MKGFHLNSPSAFASVSAWWSRFHRRPDRCRSRRLVRDQPRQHLVVTLQDTRLPAAMLIGDIRGAANQLLLLLRSPWSRKAGQRAEQVRADAGAQGRMTATLTKAMEDYDRIAKTEEQAESWKTLKESMNPWLASNAELSKVIKALAENDDPENRRKLFMEYKAPLATWGYTQARVDLNLAEPARAEQGRSKRRAKPTTVRSPLPSVSCSSRWRCHRRSPRSRRLLRAQHHGATLRALRHAIVGVASNNDFTQRASMGARTKSRKRPAPSIACWRACRTRCVKCSATPTTSQTASEQASSASQQAATHRKARAKRRPAWRPPSRK